MSDLINIEVTSGGSGQNINVEVNQSNQELILGAVAQVQQILQQMQDLINNNPVVNQNNILSWRKYGEVISGSGDISAAHVASWLNVQPYTFSVSQLQTPVVFEFTRVVNDINKKYIFFFKKGAGVWGKAAGAVQDPNKWFYASQFESLPPIPVTIDDLQQDPNAEIINIDPVVNGDYITKANQSIWDFTTSGQPGEDGNPIAFYLSYTYDNGEGDKLYFVKFVGSAGNYGSGLTPLEETDFVSSTNDGVISVPTLQEITNQGNSTDIPIAIYDTGSGATGDKTLFSGNGISHYDNIGNETKIRHKPKIGNMEVFFPAKEGEQVLAMQSDLNGLTLESNQAAAELYLKNAEGEILATINVGFLNNEGTTFYYNESTQMLELKNDAGEILSTVPVNAFVANLMQSVNFNGATPYILEFKDAQGTVVDSVSFSVSNIQGLQALLDAKVSYADMDNVPTLGSNNAAKSGGIYDMIRKHVISTEADLNNYNEAGYFLTPSSGLLNLPDGFPQTRYALTVNSANAVYGSQILVSCGFDNQIALRRKSGSSWGQWFIVWTYGNFTQSDVNKWQINKVSSDLNYPHSSTSYGSSGESMNDLPTGTYTAVLSTNTSDRPFTSLGGFISVGANGGQGTQIVGSRTGNELWFRPFSPSYGSWYRLWNSGDFTQTNIDNWNSIYADKSNYLRNQADGTVGSYLGGTSISNLNNLITGMVWTSGSVLNLPSGVSYLVLSLSGSEGYSAQLAMRNTNFFFRAQENGVWGSWKRLWHASDFTQSNINNWNNAYTNQSLWLPKSGGTMTGAIKYGSPTNNQTSFIGTHLAGTEIGYTAWMLQNLDWDSVNNKFTKPRASLLSHALALGTGDKALRLMYAPNVGSNGDDADLSTVFSVDSLGRIITLSHGTSEQWNTAFGWGNHEGLYLPLGEDIPTEADLNTYLQTGIFIQRFNFQAAAGTNYPVPLKGFLEVLRTPEGLISQKYHVTGGDENNYYIRIYGNSWSSWKKLLSNVDITDSNIDNWNTAYNHSTTTGNPHNTAIEDIPGLQNYLGEDIVHNVNFSPISPGSYGLLDLGFDNVPLGTFVQVARLSAIPAGLFLSAEVEVENLVRIRCFNNTGSTIDPDPFNIRIRLTKP